MRKIVNESSTPLVSTFWYVNGEFLGDELPWRDGELYGNFIQSPEDHVDLWKPYSLIMKSCQNRDYTWYPRGRVMVNTKLKKFVVCCDPCLLTDEIKCEILSHFNLPPGSVIWDTDEHYSCHQCRKKGEI